jgi:hypothetical protein
LELVDHQHAEALPILLGNVRVRLKQAHRHDLKIGEVESAPLSFDTLTVLVEPLHEAEESRFVWTNGELSCSCARLLHPLPNRLEKCIVTLN